MVRIVSSTVRRAICYIDKASFVKEVKEDREGGHCDERK
jgi:hypothetical protein